MVRIFVWFYCVVNPKKAPGYLDVVKNPMDFGTIKKKLEVSHLKGLSIKTHMRVCVCVCVRACVHTYVCLCVCTCMRVCGILYRHLYHCLPVRISPAIQIFHSHGVAE